MRTPDTGGPPGAQSWGCPPLGDRWRETPHSVPRAIAYMHTQTLATRFPGRPPSNPVPSGSGGTNREQTRPCRAAGLPGPPPEVRQHIRVPGTRTGRAAIWPGPFPVGFPLHRAPGRGQGHSPFPKAQKAWVSHGWGTATQVSGTPITNGVPLGLTGDGVPGRLSSWQLEAWGEDGPLGRGSKAGPRPHRRMHVCMCVRVPKNGPQTGRGGRREAGRHAPTPQPHAPRMNQGQLPPGAPPPPPPSLVPKYFPPSRSSWDRKIPRATGPALPATARPPSLSLTLCLMGLDSPQRLPGPGPEPAANLGCPAKCRLTTSPPSLTPVPAQRP